LGTSQASPEDFGECPVVAGFCLWRGAANEENVQNIARQAPVDHGAVGLSLPRFPHKQTVESPGCGGWFEVSYLR